MAKPSAAATTLMMLALAVVLTVPLLASATPSPTAASSDKKLPPLLRPKAQRPTAARSATGEALFFFRDQPGRSALESQMRTASLVPDRRTGQVKMEVTKYRKYKDGTVEEVPVGSGDVQGR